jgi:hypothetical protein
MLISLPQAAAAPDIDAIIACDSLVGIPNHHAPTAMIITDKSDAHNAPPETPAVSKMFFATVGNKTDESVTPKKLQIDASATAFFIDSAPEHTHPVIALGASVHPFTKITPSVKIIE